MEPVSRNSMTSSRRVALMRPRGAIDAYGALERALDACLKAIVQTQRNGSQAFDGMYARVLEEADAILGSQRWLEYIRNNHGSPGFRRTLVREILEILKDAVSDGDRDEMDLLNKDRLLEMALEAL